MNDKEFCDAVHMNIHAVRLLTNYKASELEKKISRLVLEKYSSTCKECKEISEKIKSPEGQKKDETFFSKIGGLLNND